MNEPHLQELIIHKVSEHINHDTKTWNTQLLNQIYAFEEARYIISTPISLTEGEDKLIWPLSSSGLYEVEKGSLKFNNNGNSRRGF